MTAPAYDFRMTSKTRTSAAVIALAAGLGGLGASTATAADQPTLAKSTVYLHVSPVETTQAACVRDLAVVKSRLKRTGNTMTKTTGCILGWAGWQSATRYRSTTPVWSVDGVDDPTLPTGGVAILNVVHGPYSFTTKTNAYAHLRWTISQIKKHPNTARYDASNVYWNTKTKRWSYTVNYHGTKALFAGDTSEIDDA